MATVSQPRIFHQCGPFNPLLADYDLDAEAPLVRLEPPICHEEARGQFAVPEDSPFCFVSSEADASQIETARGAPVEVAIRTDELRAAAERGEGTIRLSAPLTLY